MLTKWQPNTFTTPVNSNNKDFSVNYLLQVLIQSTPGSRIPEAVYNQLQSRLTTTLRCNSSQIDSSVSS